MLYLLGIVILLIKDRKKFKNIIILWPIFAIAIIVDWFAIFINKLFKADKQMGDILTIVGILVMPCLLTFVVLSIFGPNHCGGDSCRREK